MITFLSIFLLALLQVGGTPETGMLRGQVRSEGSGEPLPAATVEVVDGLNVRRVAADRNGSYVIRGVSAGRKVVRVRHLGHAPLELEVVVPWGGELWLDLMLPLQPVALEAVRVDASAARSPLEQEAAPPPDLAIAGARTIETTPGLAELGLTEAARGVPGQEPADPSDVLFVRGAAADLKLVYLDGAPVYAPFPLGGILDPFTPELLRAADVYLGGAPARYDGGLSYILDMRTRRARSDRVHAMGALDLLSARALVEAPLPANGGFFAGVRGVHGLAAPETVPYGYREGIIRADVEAFGDGLFSVTGFANREEVWLESGLRPDSAISWQNAAASLRYRGRVGATGVELTASRGDFRAEMPLNGTVPMHVDGASSRSRLAVDLASRVDAFQIRYGASMDRHNQRLDALPAGGAGAAPQLSGSVTAEVMGVYGDAVWEADRRLRLRGGLRADRFSLGPELAMAPRFAATWLVSERAALTLAAGRYHQYLRGPDATTASPATTHAGSRVPLALGRASHLSLSFDQELGEGTRFGMEGFFKNFSQVPGLNATAANSSGVDTWIRRTGGDLSGWLGYSLAWMWSVGGTLGGGDQFSGRQLLSAGASMPVLRRGSVDVSFAYGSGLPYAAIPLMPVADAPHFPGRSEAMPPPPPAQLAGANAGSPPLLPQPDRDFLRLDVAASHTFEGRWGGTPVEFSPYLRLLNTLGRRDALFYHYDRSRDSSPRPLAALPLVPVLGFEWRF